MRTRIFLSIFGTVLLALLAAAALIVSVLYGQFTLERQQELLAEVRTMARAVENFPPALEKMGAETASRITLIGADGRVHYDNAAEAAAMDSHTSRPEVRAARREGWGQAIRLSDTLHLRTYYCAVRLSDGQVLRLAVQAKTLAGALLQAAPWLAGILLLLLGAAGLAAAWLSRFVLRPLNTLDLEHPLLNDTYAELTPLLRRLDAQNTRAAEQLRRLDAKQRELDCVTEQMSEALLFVGKNRLVLFANRCARALFALPGRPDERHFLALCRDAGWTQSVEAALNGQPARARLELNGRVYRLFASPAAGGDDAFAAILFLVDITENEAAEAMRREFSANVSHELKTPLTSILGYAELIEQGIANAADVPPFAGRIRAEAARLLEMIRQVISLSRLDEGSLHKAFASVDLTGLCREVCAELTPKAEKRGVTLSVSGEAAPVPGITQMLHEMVFNLCDNAISYNKPGGRVELTVRRTDGGAELCVTDTGIGIAPAEQTRIFERFYRVDKSRAKQDAAGGSGLGLALVRHAAQLHNARLELHSVPEEGTTVRVRFGATTSPDSETDGRGSAC